MDEPTVSDHGKVARPPSSALDPLVDTRTRALALDGEDRLADRSEGSNHGPTDRHTVVKTGSRLLSDRPAAARIARFTILERIGRGGMGTVYAAYDEQLDRKVAVKVLLADELPDQDDQTRFQREAQALARLSHPHVVTVHEVGDADGELFMAMEFIRGQNLAQWLRTAPRPGWRASLEAFVQAGRGLVAVHRAGLVHRDLKPTNIMRRDDGVVKLLDFGLARAFDDADGEFDPPLDKGEASGSSTNSAGDLSTSLTCPGTVVGTPAYMSPEQLCGKTVDARSDQFSFCVALYEAIYSERPYPGQTMKALTASILAGRIRSAPKDRPAPAKLRTALLRGLANEPEARWSSMEALLEQLQRLLTPRRQRALALSAGLALGLGLLGAGLAYRTHQAHQASMEQRCTGAHTQLEGTWDEARRQTVEAAILGTQVSYASDTWARVQARLDTYADAWMGKHTEICEATAVRHEQSAAAMSLRMRCLDQRLTSLRASVDVLAEADAEVVNNAVNLVADLPPLTRCDDLDWLLRQDQRVPRPEDPDLVAEIETLRAHLTDIEAMKKAGQYAEALDKAEWVVPHANALDYAPLIAEAQYWRGDLRHANGAYTEAEQDLRHAYMVAMEHYDDDVALRAARSLIFVVGNHLARYAEGRQWGETVALPLAQRSGNPIELAGSLDNLGTVHWSHGEYDKAEEHHLRALAILEKALGPDHPLLDHTLINLGNVFWIRGQYEEAREYHLRALASARKALGPDHIHVAEILNNLGTVYLDQAEYDKAKEHFERAQVLTEKALGPDHLRMAIGLSNLGAVYGTQGEHDKAQEYFERALAIREKSIGADHPDLAELLGNLGVVHASQRNFEQAEAYHQRALSIFKKAWAADHPLVAQSLNNLGHVYSSQGKHERAKEHHERALAIFDQALGPDHPDVAQSLVGLATAALEMNDPASARTHAERAVEIYEAAAEAPKRLAVARFVLAQALWSKTRERARARALAEQAQGALTAAKNPDPSDRLLTEIEAWLTARHVTGQ
ncbi:MAG: tetratricopeptide repeat protein [Myxococcota bacterium]